MSNNKTISLSDFLDRVEQLASANPTYRTGGSGMDGTCDCIGLIMGAIRRAGGEWPWLHSSNDAARKAVTQLEPIRTAADLTAGELVFKHLEPGDNGYSLPSRYRDDPDRNDYFHVGVVLSVSPLHIRHMTSPRAALDLKLGGWTRHGWCGLIQRNMSGNTISGTPAGEDESEKKGDRQRMPGTITIESQNGLPVKLRDRPSTSCSLYWEIPSGTDGTLLSEKENWCQISASDQTGKTHTGWMKSEYVIDKMADGQDPETLVLTSEQIQEMLQVMAEIEHGFDEIHELFGGRG